MGHHPEYLPVGVRAAPTNRLTVELAPRPLAEEDIGRRWPFCVQGRVVDADRRGVEKAEIRAACGWGTLMSTQRVFTGPDGGYRIRFGPGMMSGDGAVALQCAHIHVCKPGYFERDMGRAGALGMASVLPGPADKHDFVGIVLPDKPYPLDFVLLPAAQVRGRVLDSEGRPVPLRDLCLYGGKLYPASNVLAGTEVDEAGRFEFSSVPTYLYGFQFRKPDSWTDLRSRELHLTRPGAYEVALTWDRRRDRLEVRLLRCPQGCSEEGVLAEGSGPRPDRAAAISVAPDGATVAYREGPGRVVLQRLAIRL